MIPAVLAFEQLRPTDCLTSQTENDIISCFHTKMALYGTLLQSALEVAYRLGEDMNPSILVKICNALGCGIQDRVDSVQRESKKKKFRE